MKVFLSHPVFFLIAWGVFGRLRPSVVIKIGVSVTFSAAKIGAYP